MSILRLAHYVFVYVLIYLSASKVSQGKFSSVIVVDHSGQYGQFKTLQQAVDSIPQDNDDWVEIQVRAGVYKEKVKIPINKPYISIVGEGRNYTVIEWSDGGSTETLKYSTFTVDADNFIARSITFKNTYQSDVISQAPAAVISGDKILFQDCGFIGVQDTLTDLQGRHYFENCYIEGYIDFIWGYGQSIYHGCTINVTSGRYDDRIYGAGFITAQGRQTEEATNGFVFEYCMVVGTSFGYLGRPYQRYSRVVFYKSFFDDMIVPQGWNPSLIHREDWDMVIHEEVDCTGPGSDKSKRVKWGKSISSQELNNLIYPNTFVNQDHWMESQPSPTKRPRL